MIFLYVKTKVDPSKFVIPMVRRVYPQLITQEPVIVSTEPPAFIKKEYVPDHKDSNEDIVVREIML